METKVVINFQLKIVNVLKDGFIGEDITKIGFFRKEARLQDKFILTDGLEKGNIVDINIETINENEIGKDKKSNPKIFYCVVNELTTNGFYTKNYDINTSRFKRMFWYEGRGLVTLLKEEQRIEVGDILKIIIKRL